MVPITKSHTPGMRSSSSCRPTVLLSVSTREVVWIQRSTLRALCSTKASDGFVDSGLKFIEFAAPLVEYILVSTGHAIP